jgi:peptidoglycan-associated lipoprotein
MIGCSTRVPVAPDETFRAPVGTPQQQQEMAEAERRRLEQLAAIEEKERAVREESMRRGPEGRLPEVAEGLTREAFLQEDVHFSYDSFTLSEEAKALLEQKAQWLAMYPEVSVQIEGHCDERGTIAYNLALGERRANMVKQYIVALGVDVSRIATISYGKESPIDPGHTEAAWKRNRRAHFTITNQ